jgi:hypothetical protein
VFYISLTYSQPIAGMVECICHLSYEGSVNRKIKVQVSSGISMSSMPRIAKARTVGGYGSSGRVLV